MKDIKDMTLTELAIYVESNLISMRGEKYSFEYEVANRLRELHELTRWIPVSERMPTEADADGKGYVEFWSTKYQMPYHYKYDFLPERHGRKLTHWKRITPPEGA
jgi:hypothetical protein